MLSIVQRKLMTPNETAARLLAYIECLEALFSWAQPRFCDKNVGAPLRNGLKLLGVGFSASLFGVGCTNAIVFVRQQLDSGFQPQNPPQDVLIMSAAYASYMAISSNLRYQVSIFHSSWEELPCTTLSHTAKPTSTDLHCIATQLQSKF